MSPVELVYAELSLQCALDLEDETAKIPESVEFNKSSGYYVVNLNVEFSSQDYLDGLADMLFDMIIEDLNRWVSNNYPGLYIDDAIEINKMYDERPRHVDMSFFAIKESEL